MSRNLKAATSGESTQPKISAWFLKELIPGPVTKEQFEDIFQNFKKAFIERALSAEMSHHLGYEVPDGNFKFPQAGRLNYQLFGVSGSGGHSW